MYLIKTPQFIQNLFPNYTWRIPTKEKVVYFTFDDGPIPEVTPWVLEQLAAYDAKATFFCVGENIQKNPEVFQQVVNAGHAVGNHTFNHLNGWASDNIEYFHNIRHCANQMDSILFRPPYGRLKPKQARFLQRHYRIVMWDVLSGDFDPKLLPEQCLENVINNVRPGSIVVFHDSLKAEDKLSYVLPKALEHFADQGYRFEQLNEKEMVVQSSWQKRA
ncbi:MAG: polysaccharide deacetylase family protein [Saprospiraceae bacterium]|jgi:peptidoglycan/xylan/chitin deacetylase (PgdA/CDA1 family)|nr:polysaccharide deacetylase family protein [Saprospiraceae bacterium]